MSTLCRERAISIAYTEIECWSCALAVWIHGNMFLNWRHAKQI